jgi:uncharacterized protein (TIGR03067 family)
MPKFVPLVLALAFAGGAVAQEKPAEKKSPLLGEWSVDREATTGGEFATKLKENVTRVTIDAESITAGRAAPYKLDEAKKQIDLTIDGGPKAEQGTYSGVYDLTGDTLKIHLATPGQPRPTGFDAKPTTVLIVLKKGK